MALTPAERQERSRRHRRGDHSTCDPARRCEVVERAVLQEASAAGPGRGARARKLWEQLGPRVEHDVMAGVLLEEACRVLDRLDLLRDAADMASMHEARQQTSALRSLLADIRKATEGAGTAATSTGRSKAAPPDPFDHDDEAPNRARQTGGGAGVVDLATSLAARRAAAAG